MNEMNLPPQPEWMHQTPIYRIHKATGIDISRLAESIELWFCIELALSSDYSKGYEDFEDKLLDVIFWVFECEWDCDIKTWFTKVAK